MVTDAFGNGGGIARYNCDLLTALSLSPRISEIVVLPRYTSYAAATPSKVHQLKSSPNRMLWSLRAAALAAGSKFDTVFCGHIYSLPLAAATARFTGARLWLQVHGVEAWNERGSLLPRSLSQVRLVTAVSRYTRSRLLSWSGLHPAQVRVLPNTLDAGYSPRERRKDLAERYGIAGKRTILTVGRISAEDRYKGHDRIIAVLPRVAAQIPDVVYLIAGSGNDRPWVEELARKSPAGDRVIFAGHVANEDLPDLFAFLGFVS